MKPSLHSLIPFLPLLLNHLRLPSLSVLCCNCQLRNSTQFYSSAPKLISWQAGLSKLDTVLLLCSQARTLAGWPLETRLSSAPLLPSSYPGRLASRNSTQFYSSAPKIVPLKAGLSKLDSVILLCSQAHILAGWPLETQTTLVRVRVTLQLAV
jgi:hypothetical protein